MDTTATEAVDAAIRAIVWVRDQIPVPFWWVLLSAGGLFVLYKFAQLYFGRQK